MQEQDFPAPPMDNEPFNRLAQRHGAKIRMVRCKCVGEGFFALFLRIEGCLKGNMLTELRRIPGVRRVYGPRDNHTKGLLVMVVVDLPRSSGRLMPWSVHAN